MVKSAPVVKGLASLAKYTQIACSSSGLPQPMHRCHLIPLSDQRDENRRVQRQAVPMYPGLKLFTRTPLSAHSTASDFVSCITPAFDALYAHCGCGTFTMCADIDAVLIIDTPLSQHDPPRCLAP